MKISKITDEVNKAMFLALNDVVIGELGRNTPVATGDTAASWEASYGNKLGEFTISNNRGNIVMFLEEGTKSHTIVPKTAKMLKFRIKKPIKFKNPKDNETFNREGKIFFFNKSGEAVFGYVKEGSIIYAFAKKVKHPGTQALHFVRKTLSDDSMWKRFEKHVEERIH